MDCIEFCQSYYEVNCIPIMCYDGDAIVYSSTAASLPFTPLPVYRPDTSARNPDFCMLHSTSMYGCVTVNDSGMRIVLGPVYNVPVTETLVREYMHENAIMTGLRGKVTEFLQGIPVLSYIQFLHHLTFLHLCMNHEKIDLTRHFFTDAQEYINDLASSHVSQTITLRDAQAFHNSFFYEQELYNHIKNGNTAKMQEFLSGSSYSPKEGIMANTPLRQAKNLFIGTVTKIGMLGAIPGGLDVELTYQLIDLYVRECEQLNSLEEIDNLRYAMIMDFCSRVGSSQVPDGLSKEVHICMTYIRSHTNDNLSIADVARQAGRSSSYIIKRFREELGINIGAFITRCKLEEAKSLLTYSDKSLSEISSYLCFSSQSYFQNVFKRKYGVTPMQYRKQHR